MDCTDIRIPEGYDGAVLIYFRDGEAVTSSYFTKREAIYPRDMAESVIKLLQERIEQWESR